MLLLCCTFVMFAAIQQLNATRDSLITTMDSIQSSATELELGINDTSTNLATVYDQCISDAQAYCSAFDIVGTLPMGVIDLSQVSYI